MAGSKRIRPTTLRVDVQATQSQDTVLVAHLGHDFDGSDRRRDGAGEDVLGGLVEHEVDRDVIGRPHAQSYATCAPKCNAGWLRIRDRVSLGCHFAYKMCDRWRSGVAWCHANRYASPKLERVRA